MRVCHHIAGECPTHHWTMRTRSICVYVAMCMCKAARGLVWRFNLQQFTALRSLKMLREEHKSRALDGHGEMCNGFLRSSEAIHFSMSDPSITHPWSMQGKYKISIMAITPSPKSPLPVIYPQRNNAGTYLLWLEKAGFNAFVPCGCVSILCMTHGVCHSYLEEAGGRCN